MVIHLMKYLKYKVLDDNINECRDTYFTFSKPFNKLR